MSQNKCYYYYLVSIWEERKKTIVEEEEEVKERSYNKRMRVGWDNCGDGDGDGDDDGDEGKGKGKGKDEDEDFRKFIIWKRKAAVDQDDSLLVLAEGIWEGTKVFKLANESNPTLLA